MRPAAGPGGLGSSPALQTYSVAQSQQLSLSGPQVCHPQERTGQGIYHLATRNVVHGRFHLGVGKQCRNSGPAPDLQNLPPTTPRMYAQVKETFQLRAVAAARAAYRPGSLSPGRERPLLAQK